MLIDKFSQLIIITSNNTLVKQKQQPFDVSSNSSYLNFLGEALSDINFLLVYL